MVIPLALVGIAIVWVGADDNRARAAFTIAIVVGGIGLVFVKDLLSKFGVTSLKVPGVELTLASAPASRSAGEDESDVGGPIELTGTSIERWLAVRWRLEMKLTYLAKHTLPDHASLIRINAHKEGWDRPYATIGSLNYDELLETDDATLATMLLALSPTDLRLLKKLDLENLLHQAEVLAGNLRLKVFRKILSQYLERLHCTVERDGDRFLRIVHLDAGVWRLAPVFSKADGHIANSRVKLLEGMATDHARVVVPKPPDAERIARTHPARSPLVVRIDQLPAAMGITN